MLDRNSHDAALDRIDKLEAENARLVEANAQLRAHNAQQPASRDLPQPNVEPSSYPEFRVDPPSPIVKYGGSFLLVFFVLVEFLQFCQ